MTVLKITEWTKITPESPGWKSIDGFRYIIENPSTIPPEYFNQVIISNYVDILYIMFDISTTESGLLGYHAFLESDGTLMTVVEFDTMQNAVNFYANQEANPIYNDNFVPARSALLNLFNVQMLIHNLTESSINLATSSAEDIRALVS